MRPNFVTNGRASDTEQINGSFDSLIASNGRAIKVES